MFPTSNCLTLTMVTKTMKIHKQMPFARSLQAIGKFILSAKWDKMKRKAVYYISWKYCIMEFLASFKREYKAGTRHRIEGTARQSIDISIPVVKGLYWKNDNATNKISPLPVLINACSNQIPHPCLVSIENVFFVRWRRNLFEFCGH